MRSFDQSLKEVKRLLLTMGERLEIAIDKAVRSLATLNDVLARQVVLEDKEINRLETMVDDTVAKLIATQQPVAKDLRLLIAAIKIASDMERMADLAVNIAQVTIQMKENGLPLFKELIDIPQMAKITQKMVNDGINSYIDGNTELAKQLAEMDDQVDQIYYRLLQELSAYMQKSQHVEVAMKLSFVARYLERIADHATNIAESIIYIETGNHVDLN